ncbi:HTTM domain-containing protein [Alienimonas californiensis]|uniref:Sporulation-delaying protein SdpB n=1 Tax=Alienimonas californiensis TaxID=2527989 RepID=A0A517P5E6_9PLAN|nr:HTTM domain-containing protein [Alienimonas californiensis]QDT14597.1 Sporulation-delaying protein SdpB [Alienimonas californiensis]
MRGYIHAVAAFVLNLPRRLATDAADLAAAYHRFWFAPSAPYTLGVVRMLAGGMALYSTAIWGLEFDAFFTNGGFQPLEMVNVPGTMSFWFFVPDAWAWPAHLLCLGALALYTVGLGTIVTKWLAFVIVASYAQRAPMATFGLDQIETFLTLYLALAPCGAAYSVDALLRKRRGGGSSRNEVSPRTTVATRLIQVHLCVLYTFAGLAKLKGEAWWDGTAIWKAISNLEYQTADLTWLAAAEPVGHLITHVTVVWELTFWALVWRPRLRPYVLAIGTGMHLGIGAFLGMWTFGLVMTFAYVAFVPPETFRPRLSRPTPQS